MGSCASTVEALQGEVQSESTSTVGERCEAWPEAWPEGWRSVARSMELNTDSPVLTLTVINLSGDSKGTFEVRATDKPLHLLLRLQIDAGFEGQLLMDDAVLSSVKTFAEQGVYSEAVLTLTVMPLGSKLSAEGFDPKLVCLESRPWYVRLLYDGTEVLKKECVGYYTYCLTPDAYWLHASPVFNAPLSAADDVPSVDVLQELRNAKAGGLIQSKL